jgi:hypothetical protein
MRSRYGVAYFGCHDPRHTALDFAEIAQHFQWVCLPITETDIRYSADTVAQLLAAAHDAGLEVWCSPWAVGGLFGGEAVSAVENFCPRSEPVQAVLDRWLAVVATAGADVVMWDEPRGRCGSPRSLSGATEGAIR